MSDSLLVCWGKTARSAPLSTEYHPALYHMLDVGHVAQLLLSDSASPRWRRVLMHSTGLSLEAVRSWVPFWIALHDIGKVSAPFAFLNEAQVKRMITEGIDFAHWTRADSSYLPHNQVGQLEIPQLLEAAGIALPLPWRQLLAHMIGGHHGVFVPHAPALSRQRLKSKELPLWSEMRLETVRWLYDHFMPSDRQPLPECADSSAATAALTGFAILADWLGSDDTYFAVDSQSIPSEYKRISAERALNAVAGSGFIDNVSSRVPTPVSELFKNLDSLRPLQTAIDEIPAELLLEPCLAIMEAPTGEGKTEAALALAHRLAQASGSDEFYYALPSMATSNQMYNRVRTYLARNLKLSPGAQLVHGQAHLVQSEYEPLPNGDVSAQIAPNDTSAVEWFGSSRKKALLAPFGVGTVDQAELAVLNTRHNMLRLIALAGKVVIIDEVHAYDTYMTTILEQLLRWLRSLGTSVILLSATLPKKQRTQLATAYIGTAESELIDIEAYPSILAGHCVIERVKPSKLRNRGLGGHRQGLGWHRRRFSRWHFTNDAADLRGGVGKRRFRPAA